MSISLVTPLQMCKTPRCFFLKLMPSERISSFMYFFLVKAHIAFLLKFIITFTTYSNLQHTSGSLSIYNIFISGQNILLRSVVCFRFALVKYSYRYMYVSIVCGLSCASRKWHQNYIHHNNLNYADTK